MGPYYAMFPLEFAEDAILGFTEPGQLIVDPFCGRGTVPYVAMVTGRASIACDINPVAWVYAMTKTSPASDLGVLLERVGEVQGAIVAGDEVAENDFQSLAFCPAVLAYINSARRVLKWRTNAIDRCVAAFLVHYLHSKLGEGLSNQMRHSKAMSPKYCVQWWRKHGLTAAPLLDPVEFLKAKIRWRYAKGLPQQTETRAIDIGLGDAAAALPASSQQAELVVTSPPYSGITDYRTDSWLRLWALGEGPSLPTWHTQQKYVHLENYTAMVRRAFAATNEICTADCTWLVRSDARPRTRNVLESLLLEIAGERGVYALSAPFSSATQTALYGDTSPKPGEIDLLIPPADKCRIPAGFEPIDQR
ncbi:MAG: DNA methyltransferase [Acidimicrobiaceae bacterium]|nr:DNA methyltransferase [Acidimicrobiaceae bacterium]